MSSVSPGYIEKDAAETFRDKWYRIFIDIDFPGLVLLAAGVALLLLPLTLANDAKGKWNNRTSTEIQPLIINLTYILSGSMIAMIVLGPFFLIAFGVYEWKFAPRPLAPPRFFKNKSIVGASLIGFFDFVSFIQYFLAT